jgi:hypothetical protein
MDDQTFRAAIAFLLAAAVFALGMATVGFVGVQMHWWSDAARFYAWSGGAWLGIAIGVGILRIAI